MVKWYSLFSHTGKETEQVRKQCADLVELQTAITNLKSCERDFPCECLGSAKAVNEWLMTPGNVQPGSIVTLNGYMRILPAEVLEYLDGIKCKVYNIHPAPINVYPELKGADPQERLYDGIQSGKYIFEGLVILEVDPGVDTGDIVLGMAQAANVRATKDQLYRTLHDMGTKAWCVFFQEVINGQNN